MAPPVINNLTPEELYDLIGHTILEAAALERQEGAIRHFRAHSLPFLSDRVDIEACETTAKTRREVWLAKLTSTHQDMMVCYPKQNPESWGILKEAFGIAHLQLMEDTEAGVILPKEMCIPPDREQLMRQMFCFVLLVKGEMWGGFADYFERNKEMFFAIARENEEKDA